MERERIEAIRAMVDLQAKRHSELGGPESSYQVAIDPSELAYLLDSTRARRVGEAVLLSRGYDARVYDEEADEIDEAYCVPVGLADTWRAIAEALRGEP